MAKRSIDKQLLSNYLRHADGHNKIQEEQEMWRIRSLELKRERIFDDWERKIRQPPLARGRLVSDTLDNDSRGYSSSSPPSSPSQSHSPKAGGTRASCKQRMREEERDPFRWGHAGYKELYPEEFVSSDNEGSGKDENEKRKTRKGHSRKRKREHKDKTKTKRRKLKTREEKGEGSFRKKQEKAKKRKQRQREKEVESSTSDSDDQSYNENSSDSELDEHVHKRVKKRTSKHKQK